MNQQDFDHLPPVLTVDEVAQVLRIGRNTAYEAVKNRTIFSFRIGRRLCVPKVALIRLFDGEQGEVSDPRRNRSESGTE